MYPIGENHNRKHKKNHVFLTITVFFAGIMFFLIYTSFYDSSLGSSITGKVISGGNFNEGINIDSNLLIPSEFFISGKMGKIELRKKGENIFFVGNKKFELKDSSIVLDSYEGEIGISGNIITKLKGSADKVFVEGIPITSDLEISVSFSDDVSYSYLKLNELNINELSFESSGTVKLNEGKAIVILEDELFRMQRFSGDLEFRGSKLKIKGKIKSSNLGFIGVNQ